MYFYEYDYSHSKDAELILGIIYSLLVFQAKLLLSIYRPRYLVFLTVVLLSSNNTCFVVGRKYYKVCFLKI